MHPEDTTYGEVRNGILTLSGNGFKISVDGGALRVVDGAYGDYRDVRLRRASCGIKRVIVTRPDGAITFAAIKWLHGIGAGIVQLDWDGRVLLASAPQGLDSPSLRRAQVLAGTTDVGLAIMRIVMQRKIAGQAAVLRRMGSDNLAEKLDKLAEDVATVPTMPRLAVIESNAAATYWAGWELVPVTFARRDTKSVPNEWQRFGKRASPITKAPRKAATPGNAIANYLYGILEAETRIACQTMGLDPGLGFLHADQPSRDSLALDLMEAARPEVDRWFFEWLQEARFSKHDFFEEQDGTVRLTRALMSHLAATVGLWSAAIGPVVELVAGILSGKRVPTRLTQANRSAGRDGIRRWDGQKRQTTNPVPRTCVECGKALTDRRRRFCSDVCRIAHHHAEAVPRFAQAGPAALAKRRSEGDDPAHGGEAGRKRGRTNAKRAEERAAWEAEHGDGAMERDLFVHDLLPKLQNMPLSRIVEATGFSLRYASLIRRGLYVPHPVHYISLTRIVDSS